MSSSVAVSIALHGLIALVPVTTTGSGALKASGATGANHMAALLVDARDPTAPQDPAAPQAAACFAAHTPRLVFAIPDSSRGACLSTPLCSIVKPSPSAPTTCSCDITGQRIWLTPDRSPAMRQFLPWAPAAAEIPALENGAHLDFSYLPNMDRLGAHLDPAFLNAAPTALLARMTFPFDDLIPCTFAVRPQDKDNDNVHSFSFRQLNEPYAPQTHPSEAVAQKLIATINYTITDQPLTLHIGDLGGVGDVAIALVQSGTAGIELQNQRLDIDPDDPCNDGVGRDFGLFYQLAGMSPRAWTSVPLPHVKLTTAKDAKTVADPACDAMPMKGLMSRPICTMASFIE